MRKFRSLALASVVASIVGCGGGGGGSESNIQGAPPPSPATPNSAPTIQGQPPSTVIVGQPYAFTPSANDANGDPLTFSATGLPSWAQIDSGTGRISGTPTAVGTSGNITIQVSDGRASASLSAFTITVSDVAVGSATIAWTAPTQNTDGSALTDLAGYEIRYGRNPAFLDQLIAVNTVGVTMYVVPNLTAGTWYFSIVSRNSAGVTSTPSELAAKDVG